MLPSTHYMDENREYLAIFDPSGIKSSSIPFLKSEQLNLHHFKAKVNVATRHKNVELYLPVTFVVWNFATKADANLISTISRGKDLDNEL